MATIPIALANVKVNKRPVYDPGVYRLRIVQVEQRTSLGGNPKLTIRFEVIDGPDGSEENAGNTLYADYPLTENALFRFKRLWTSAGLDEAAESPDDQELVDRVVMATVSIEKYQGEDRNRVGNERSIDEATGAEDSSAAEEPAPQTLAPPPPAAKVGNGSGARTAPPAPPPPAPRPKAPAAAPRR